MDSGQGNKLVDFPLKSCIQTRVKILEISLPYLKKLKILEISLNLS